jgi:hypothetical protein
MNRDEFLSAAAAALDALYASRPANLAERLSPVQQQIAAVRDDIRGELKRGSGDRALLERVNQALTLLHSAAYPAGAVDWQHLAQAREAIQGNSLPEHG